MSMETIIKTVDEVANTIMAGDPHGYFHPDSKIYNGATEILTIGGREVHCSKDEDKDGPILSFRIQGDREDCSHDDGNRTLEWADSDDSDGQKWYDVYEHARYHALQRAFDEAELREMDF